MGITDELRKYAEDWGWLDMPSKEAQDRIEGIADRIDEAHKKVVRELNDYASDSVLLPRDADGEVIHVGDVMVYADGNTCPLPVVALVPPAVFLTEDGPRYADMCRHYHAPTVKDVLREFAEKVIDSQIPSVHPSYEEAIAEYAAKLRLAGEDV